MTLSEELVWRGHIKDKTFSDVAWLDTPRTFYLGADCSSADSLTIGNLAIFMLAKRLNAAGWKTILLVGGATSLIGDPGGKDDERQIKDRAEIAANVAGIKQQVQKLFAGAEFTLVDNYDWFKAINFLDFLRDVGKLYSMTELVQRDFISERMGEGGSGISYAEFSYTLIQGYDYWQLYKDYGVVLQIGGSDQWGNMLSGVPLIRKKESAEVHALSAPLILDKTTGKKFGKSEAGAVWLDPAQTSPTQFYQFWINTDDLGVADYLKIYTDLDQAAIAELMEQHMAEPQARTAQRTLAQEVTRLVHGAAAAATAQEVTAYLTGQASIAAASDAALEAIRHELPSIQSAPTSSIIEALVSANLAPSNSEARRLIEGNAISLNGIKSVRENFQASDFVSGRLLLRRGKAFKDSALVELGD
ncbi:MAG: tyrosine--tRNA ligase [Candidatus Saccharibacteria bacterium]